MGQFWRSSRKFLHYIFGTATALGSRSFSLFSSIACALVGCEMHRRRNSTPLRVGNTTSTILISRSSLITFLGSSPPALLVPFPGPPPTPPPLPNLGRGFPKGRPKKTPG